MMKRNAANPSTVLCSAEHGKKGLMDDRNEGVLLLVGKPLDLSIA